MSLNPFLTKSNLEYELPPFSEISEEDYLPAFYAGMDEQLAEVEKITDQGIFKGNFSLVSDLFNLC